MSSDCSIVQQDALENAKLADELCQLYGRIDCDAGNRFARMHRMIERNPMLFHRYGERLLELCDEHERTHRKSSLIANIYLTRAEKLYEKHCDRLERTKLTTEQYSEMFECWNQALLHSPIDWQDCSTILALVKIYVDRAVIEFDFDRFELANSNLRLASSAINNFNDIEQMAAYFAHNDCELLITLASLKVKLLRKLDFSIPIEFGYDHSSLLHLSSSSASLLQETIGRKTDIDNLLDAIRSIDSWLDANDRARVDDDDCGTASQELANANYYCLSTKVRLQSEQSNGSRTENNNRTLAATHYIAKGETILIERPHMTLIYESYQFEYCNHCRRSIGAFWPCGGCTEVGYCSIRCATEAEEEYHRAECGIYGMIMCKENFHSMAHLYRNVAKFGLEVMIKCEDDALLSHAKNNDKDDYHESEEECFRIANLASFREQTAAEREQLCRSFCALLSHRGKHRVDRECAITARAVSLLYCLAHKGILHRDLLFDQPKVYGRLLEHFATGMLRICTNGFCWDVFPAKRTKTDNIPRIGSCVYLIGSLMNHSCMPNVDWDIKREGVLQLTAKRSIMPGESLTDCYGPKRYTPFAARQYRLSTQYCFYCRCVVCMKDAANDPTALQCISGSGATSNCDGPLMTINQIRACLRCNYGDGGGVSKRTIFIADKMDKTLARASQNFDRILHKLLPHAYRRHRKHDDDEGEEGEEKDYGDRKWIISTPACLMTADDAAKRDEKRKKQLADLLQNFAWNEIAKTKLKNANNKITMSIVAARQRLPKLEKYFDIYAKIAYTGSYHLLAKCVTLIHVYRCAQHDERAICLLRHLRRCVEHVYPELTDMDLVSLVYMLDYVASFYAKLALTCVGNISHNSGGCDGMAKMVAEIAKLEQQQQEHHRIFEADSEKPAQIITSSNKLDSSKKSLSYHLLINDICSLCIAIDTKLIDILQHDMTQVGDFFPKTLRKSSKFLKEVDDDDDVHDDDDLPIEFHDDEQYFRQLYLDSHRRLESIQNLMQRY